MSLAIIGAGPSGLVSAKSALECGLKPTVLEKNSKIGGLWKPDNGSTWENMQTNLSRYTCMFSDFPWNSHSQLFPSQSEVYDYLTQYAKHYNLFAHIYFDSEVIRVQKHKDKWLVQCRKNSDKISQIFDYIIIAPGVFSKRCVPEIKGYEKFKGQILHSSDYKNPSPFKNKKVTVIGSAFSGTEIVSEVAIVAEKVMHVINRPYWVIPRFLPKNSQLLPLDFVFYRRAAQAASQLLSEEESNLRKHLWFKEISQQEVFHSSLSIEPSQQPAFVTISDRYLQHVKERDVNIIKSNITELNDTHVIFKDATCKETDVIIFCTGYQTNLSFLDQKILELLDFKQGEHFQPLILHKCTWHPDLQNMAFVGLYRGPFFAVMELQARWACYVFSKLVTPPSLKDMQLGLLEEKSIREKKPRPQFPHGDYIGLADSLAEEIGVLPPLSNLQQEDTELYHQLWEGPYLPSHFRLHGFGCQTTLARQIIGEANQLFLSFRP